jgi:hypothetical protein
MKNAFPDHDFIDLRDPESVRTWIDALDISPKSSSARWRRWDIRPTPSGAT